MAKSEQEEQAKSKAGHTFALKADSLRRDGSESVYRQLYGTLKEAILAGTFPHGARLPSSRSLAAQLGLSRTTVDLAYNLLAGDGLVQGRTARGTLVTSDVPRRRLDERSARAPDAKPPPAGPTAQAALAPGVAAVDLFPRKTWSRLATRHTRNLLAEDLLAQHPAGLQRLREAIANRVRLVRGMATDADQVFVTAGVGAAALLVCTALELQGRRAIASPDSMSAAACHAFQAAGVRMAGPELAAFSNGRHDDAGLSALHAEDFVMHGPAFEPVAHAMGQWAQRHSGWILEEDGDLDLFGEGPFASMLTRGAADRTIYLGSFERIVFPAVGCAFLAVPQALAGRFMAAAQASPWQVAPPLQRTLSDFITQGFIGRHANRLRLAHAERRRSALAALRDGRATGRLSFAVAGSSLVANIGDAKRLPGLQAALHAAGLGARMVADIAAPGKGALLQVGYAGAPKPQLARAVEQLDALLLATL